MDSVWMLTFMRGEIQVARVLARVPWEWKVYWYLEEDETAYLLSEALKRSTGEPLEVRGFRDTEVIAPDDPRYPKAVAKFVTDKRLLGMWAYTTDAQIWVTLSQIRLACGTQKTSLVREALKKAGIACRIQAQRHLYSLRAVHCWNRQVGSRILLRPHQAAAFLGVARSSISGILGRLADQGMPVVRVGENPETRVAWGILRRVKRVGPRSFRYEVASGDKNIGD
jgi:hypothetical protein